VGNPIRHYQISMNAYHHPNYIKSLTSRFNNALRYAKRDAVQWATNDPKGMFFLGKPSAEKRIQEHLEKAKMALQEARDTGHFSDEEMHTWIQQFADISRHAEDQLNLR